MPVSQQCWTECGWALQDCALKRSKLWRHVQDQEWLTLSTSAAQCFSSERALQRSAKCRSTMQGNSLPSACEVMPGVLFVCHSLSSKLNSWKLGKAPGVWWKEKLMEKSLTLKIRWFPFFPLLQPLLPVVCSLSGAVPSHSSQRLRGYHSLHIFCVALLVNTLQHGFHIESLTPLPLPPASQIPRWSTFTFRAYHIGFTVAQILG